MAKVALLIGVSEYEPGLASLPTAKSDVEALSRVLQDSDIGAFDQVRTLVNPTRQEMAEALEELFVGRAKDDLVLLYFSGHGIKDESGRLYLTTRTTRTNPTRELVRSTAIEASFIHQVMNSSRSRRQVVILDCSFSGAFGRDVTVLPAKDDGSIDVRAQLGGSGRAILTSSTSTQYSFEQVESNLSIYTRYLVEGIATGAADLDGDGFISVDELHDYVGNKVRQVSPAMSPMFYSAAEGFRILLARAPVADPRLMYRKEVENLLRDGDLSPIGRTVLQALQAHLSLSPQEASAIEAEILRPYQEYRRKLQEYEQAWTEAVNLENPLSETSVSELRVLQQILNLRDEDIAGIEARITSIKKLADLPKLPPFLNYEAELSKHNPSLLARFAKAICNLILRLLRAIQPDSTSFDSSYDDLSSDLGLDYTLLKNLLSAQRWRDADYETYKMILRGIGRKEGDSIKEEEIRQFPCRDLRTLDGLWVKYSNGKFGFSVQRKIYLACDGKINGNHYETSYRRFGERVGWRNKGRWIPYYDLIFDLSAPTGHLPRPGGWVKGLSSLFSRLDTCGL